jgi:hypothetical protein
MYDASVTVFNRVITNLEVLLDKAVAFADERKIDHNALLLSRLSPDMFTFTRQIQIATDVAKGTCGRLAGIEVPKFEDNDTSFDDLKARCAKLREFLATLTPAQFEGAETRQISFKIGPPNNQTTMEFVGADYVQVWGVPNVYFHYSMVYALLRHNGVPVGKRDYLG